MAARETTPSPEFNIPGFIPDQTFDWDIEEIKLQDPEKQSSSDEDVKLEDIEDAEVIHSISSRRANIPEVFVEQPPTTEQGHLPSKSSSKSESKSPSPVAAIFVSSGQSTSSSKDTKRKKGYIAWAVEHSKQQRVESKSLDKRSKSPSPGPSSQSLQADIRSKSPSPGPSSQWFQTPPRSPRHVERQRSPCDVQQQMPSAEQRSTKLFGKSESKVGVYRFPINLATITKQDNVPPELADVSCYGIKLDAHKYVPIVYDKQYNLKSAPNLKLSQKQAMVNNKPAHVHRKLLRKMSAKEKCVQWNAVDISSVYDISEYLSPYMRQHNVAKIAELMRLVLPKPLPSWEDFSSVILRPLRVQMMGSVVACKLALDEGWAINIGGGFSHYTTNIGGGLAVYDDVLVCLAVMSNMQNVNHILVLNLDAYQSPSYQYAKNINCNVTIIDIYSEKIFEEADVSGGACNDNILYHEFDVTLQKTRRFDGYMDYVKSVMEELIHTDLTKPSLCIYVAGSTTLADNPHTKLNFTKKDLVERDAIVVNSIIHRYNIPVAILLGGGYHSYDVEAAKALVVNLYRL